MDSNEYLDEVKPRPVIILFAFFLPIPRQFLRISRSMMTREGAKLDDRRQLETFLPALMEGMNQMGALDEVARKKGRLPRAGVWNVLPHDDQTPRKSSPPQ